MLYFNTNVGATLLKRALLTFISPRISRAIRFLCTLETASREAESSRRARGLACSESSKS